MNDNAINMRPTIEETWSALVVALEPDLQEAGFTDVKDSVVSELTDYSLGEIQELTESTAGWIPKLLAEVHAAAAA